MTYIDYLNKFHRWNETHSLPSSSKLLYLCLLDVFNRAGWPEIIQIDNIRLTVLAGVSTEKTAIKAREELIKNGVISYKKGSKGKPGAYRLEDIYCNNYSIYYSENDSLFDSVCDSKNDRKNDRHIKIKTKDKEEDIIEKVPTEPKRKTGEIDELIQDTGFSENLQSAFLDWLEYKKERREGYKPTGLKSLIAQIQKNVTQYGDTAVIDVIQQCMSCGYRGIIFKMLKERRKKQGGEAGGDTTESPEERWHLECLRL